MCNTIKIKTFFNDDDGVGAQEYVMAAACIALVIIASIGVIGTTMNNTYNTLNTSVGTVMNSTTVTGPVTGGTGGSDK
jgi:Flp pilus assembly pilin Flp